MTVGVYLWNNSRKNITAVDKVINTTKVVNTTISEMKVVTNHNHYYNHNQELLNANNDTTVPSSSSSKQTPVENEKVIPNQAVLIIEEANKMNLELTQKMVSVWAMQGLKNITAATPSDISDTFITDGRFERIFGNGLGKTEELELSKDFSHLILGKKEVNFIGNSDNKNLITAKVSLVLRIISLQTGKIEERDKFEKEGTGYTEKRADEEAIKKILKDIIKGK
jgi:hypothetical protein